MKQRKPEDIAAASIEFGVELETMIPHSCGVSVGPYHRGENVVSGFDPLVTVNGGITDAPMFNGKYWRADLDGSIVIEDRFKACEFVSPVLKGDAGVSKLVEFVQFAKRIGAKVNKSCGCHITVGVPSLIGGHHPDDVVNFIHRLTRVVNRHAWAIYAQTGTDRHACNYANPLPKNAWVLTNDLKRDALTQEQTSSTLSALGRGIVNFQKTFPPDHDLTKSCVEFRAFAGTLNEQKILHHLATVFGLCRRAASAAHVPTFIPRGRQPTTARAALERLWSFLGWDDDFAGPDKTVGQFGLLYREFPEYSQTALKLADKFQEKFPKAKVRMS